MNRLVRYAIVGGLLLIAGTAQAIPSLQLYIDGATFDAVNETWLINSNSFDLWVLGNVEQGMFPDPPGVFLAASFYGAGSLTLTPTTTGAVPDPSIPPLPNDLGNHPELFADNQAFTGGVQHHDEYAGTDSHNFWALGPMLQMDSPIYDYTAGGPSGTPAMGQINVYHVDITGFDMVHFDAFGTQVANGRVRFVKAPFSHDAGTGPPVPEPGTLALFGAGLAGLALRRIRASG